MTTARIADFRIDAATSMNWSLASDGKVLRGGLSRVRRPMSWSHSSRRLLYDSMMPPCPQTYVATRRKMRPRQLAVAPQLSAGERRLTFQRERHHNQDASYRARHGAFEL